MMPVFAARLVPSCWKLLLTWMVLGTALPGLLWGQPASTRPLEGLEKHTPGDVALVGARVISSPGIELPEATLIIRDGVIAQLAAEVPVPADVRVIPMQGKTIYPAFLDAYSEQSIALDTAKGSSPYWNPMVRPQLSAASHFAADSDRSKELRKQGFAARLVAPGGGIVRGTSCLVSTADGGLPSLLLRSDVALHLRLTVSRGGGRDDYPNSPMGAVALARQSFYDADWYERAMTAYRADRKLARPDRNDALESLASMQTARLPVMIDAANELAVLRADRFAREFSLPLVVRGSGNEYRRLTEIAGLKRSMVIPLNFPKPPNVGAAEAAANVRLEQLMHWDLAPENPARLVQAGVTVALTSHGLKEKSDFLSNLRKAVARGLRPQDALAALTTTPAELLGVSDRMGSLAAGKLANLIVTEGDLFADKTKVLETWVQGKRYEHDKAARHDPRGSWQVTAVEGPALSLLLQLKGEPKKLTGTASLLPAADPAQEIKLAKVSLRDARLSTLFQGKPFDKRGDGFVQLTLVLTGGEGLAASGQVVWPDGFRQQVTAVRKPAADQPAEPTEKPGESPSDKRPQASFAVNYPLGAYGRETPPEQPTVVFRNATVWTCGPQGVLENASVAIQGGRIVGVGQELALPPGAIQIDAKGMHITPGIIDCHSHMATDGGVNESGQAITAEVRIGDFIDADDITIYRQLAGGVTSSNILHGSANPIGGQNQVIKLRWGSTPEAMKFAEAPAGIKFALGENVKQSNWGDEYTSRYPQTRMGVDQLIQDTLHRARRYRQRRQQWEQHHQGLPPRRDLELDAIAEILAGERWIHCHSYRQDEILALIRTLDTFKVQIGTFQHILEGYKVAAEMARHGAMGSAFSDWWAYKFEVYDAIPYNGALMHRAGVVVSFNSDDRELARHLNHEAAKAVKYGGVPPEEALKFVTLNPARQLRIEQYVGSLEVNKHADLVIWSGDPLSTMSRCEQTWIDGRKYFDREEDAARRETVQSRRHQLIQKVLASGETMLAPGEKNPTEEELWPRDDIFCHRHGHGHGHQEHK